MPDDYPRYMLEPQKAENVCESSRCRGVGLQEDLLYLCTVHQGRGPEQALGGSHPRMQIARVPATEFVKVEKQFLRLQVESLHLSALFVNEGGA